MLRVSEIKLPLDHGPDALSAAILERLRVPSRELESLSVFRRAHDARKKSAILLIYTVDVGVRDEKAVLSRFASDHRVHPTPDIGYRFAPRAPEGFNLVLS